MPDGAATRAHIDTRTQRIHTLHAPAHAARKHPRPHASTPALVNMWQDSMLLKPQRLNLPWMKKNEDTPSPSGNSLTALETEQTNEEKAAEKASKETDAEQKTYKEAVKLAEDKAAAAEQAMAKHAVSSKAERAAPSKSAKAEAAVKKPDHGLALHVASSPGSAACKAQAPHSLPESTVPAE